MKLLARNKIFALLSLSRFLNTLGAAIYNLVFVVFAASMPQPSLAVGIANLIVFIPSLSIIFGLSSKTQWLSGLYYADFISFYSPTQLCGDGTTKSNSNELPISVPLSFQDSLISSCRPCL